MEEWVRELNSLSPGMAGMLMAMLIAVIQVIYDNQETRPLRIFLEATLCGALSLTASYGIEACGLNQNWSVFAGGVIGYLGSSSVRSLALSMLDKKIKGGNDE